MSILQEQKIATLERKVAELERRFTALQQLLEGRAPEIGTVPRDTLKLKRG